MKKLNNKGMTLVELIVSFAIVTVAVVYFSQSLITTSKLFRNTKKETDEYADKVYALRMLEAMFKEYYASSNISGGFDKNSKVMGVAGNKNIGFDTIFVYCNNENPLSISPIFNLDSTAQKGALNIDLGFLGDLQIKKFYPRNLQNGYIGQSRWLIRRSTDHHDEKIKKDCENVLASGKPESKNYPLFRKFQYLIDLSKYNACEDVINKYGSSEEISEEGTEDYDDTIDTLTTRNATEYKNHPGLKDTVDWQQVGGATCKTFDKEWYNTDEGVGAKDFENGNYWLPVEYYDYLNKDVHRDFDTLKVLEKWRIFKKNDGTKFGFTSINNYYNPYLKLFASVGTYKKKKYVYYTSFNYKDFVAEGKEFKYFLIYQLGTQNVLNTSEDNSEYEKTVRLKTFCTGNSGDCNKAFNDADD